MPPAAVRRRRDPEASRLRLLEAGSRLFADLGIEGASVARIARQAGLNRRMLYHYFGSKDGLYRAVIESAYRRLSSIEVELAHMLLPAEDLLAKMIRAYYDFLAANPDVVRLLAWENLRRGEVSRRMDMSSFKAPILEALRLALARGKSEGRFRRDLDEKQVLISCMALSFFYFSNQYTLGRALGVDLADPAAIQRRVSHVVKLILDGIRADGGRHQAAQARARATR
jgi:TetR/AcrR family transcriptional regulator